jgi:hypothetical protein
MTATALTFAQAMMLGNVYETARRGDNDARRRIMERDVVSWQGAKAAADQDCLATLAALGLVERETFPVSAPTDQLTAEGLRTYRGNVAD